MGAWVLFAYSNIPKGVFKRMPYIVLTIAQTSIALPYALNHVEDFFRRAAHGDRGRVVRGLSSKIGMGKLKEG